MYTYAVHIAVSLCLHEDIVSAWGHYVYWVHYALTREAMFTKLHRKKSLFLNGYIMFWVFMGTLCEHGDIMFNGYIMILLGKQYFGTFFRKSSGIPSEWVHYVLCLHGDIASLWGHCVWMGTLCLMGTLCFKYWNDIVLGCLGYRHWHRSLQFVPLWPWIYSSNLHDSCARWCI